ncbi:MAG: hypothetical protein ACJ77E_04955 [Gaiellaceae bacterium]
MRARAAVAAVLALATAGLAGAASLDRGYTAIAPVSALDATAAGIATGLAWTPRSCEAVALWQPDSFARRTFRAPGPCDQTSTGRGIAGVSTDGDRVVWLAYAGGNDRDWLLWTATPTGRTPRRLRFRTADVDSPPPIVLGNGGEGGIPYALGQDVIVIGPRGRRALFWHAPARVVALAQGAGKVGALLATGHLFVVPLRGGAPTDLGYAPNEVRAFRIAAVGAVVQTAARIELRTVQRRTPLLARPGARLVGFVDGQLVYALGDQIRRYTRASGRDVLLRRVRRPFRAEYDRRGLAWVTGRRVCWAVRVLVEPGAGANRC